MTRPSQRSTLLLEGGGPLVGGRLRNETILFGSLCPFFLGSFGLLVPDFLIWFIGTPSGHAPSYLARKTTASRLITSMNYVCNFRVKNDFRREVFVKYVDCNDYRRPVDLGLNNGLNPTGARHEAVSGPAEEGDEPQSRHERWQGVGRS